MSEVRRQTRATSAPGGRAPSRNGGLHLSVGARQQRGRDARARIARSSHARFEAWPGRPDFAHFKEAVSSGRIKAVMGVYRKLKRQHPSS